MKKLTRTNLLRGQSDYLRDSTVGVSATSGGIAVKGLHGQVADTRLDYMKKKTKNTPGINCRVSPELRHQVEGLAQERGWPLMALVRDALTRYVADPPEVPSTDPTRLDGRSKWQARA